MILFFDTETTGLTPGRIIQLSYIMYDKNGVKAKNFFFAVDYIPLQATAVHGFTAEKIYELSGGNTFSVYADEIYDDFFKADLIIAHNIKFDIMFMIAEFGYLDIQFRYKEAFDTMKYFTTILKLPRKNNIGYKYPKLTEVTEFMEIYPYDISREISALFGTLGISCHDARYDTSAMFLAFNIQAQQDENLQLLLKNKVCDKKVI